MCFRDKAVYLEDTYEKPRVKSKDGQSTSSTSTPAYKYTGGFVTSPDSNPGAAVIGGQKRQGGRRGTSSFFVAGAAGGQGGGGCGGGGGGGCGGGGG